MTVDARGDGSGQPPGGVSQPPGPLLVVEGLEVAYGPVVALRGIDLEVRGGEVVTLIGANGAGKTTTLRALSGLVRPRRGRILWRGQDLTRLPPHRIVAAGIAHVPEGRRIFANLTVEENLRLATYGSRLAPYGSPGRRAVAARLEEVYALFPRLAERRRQPGGTLSGGEQQMLALGRALMTRPALLLLDEPSMGLAPRLVEEITFTLAGLPRAGTALLLVEQNAALALELASRAYVLEAGRVVLAGPARELAADFRVRAAYLGS